MPIRTCWSDVEMSPYFCLFALAAGALWRESGISQPYTYSGQQWTFR